VGRGGAVDALRSLVDARTGGEHRPQQEALVAAVEQALADHRFPTPPAVAHRSHFMFDYSGARHALQGLPVQQVKLPLDADWLRAHRPPLLIVSDMDEIIIWRNHPVSREAETLRALAAGELPYRLVADIPVSYFQRDLYGWLDPYFRVSYERGQVGFRVYASTGDDGTRRAARETSPTAHTGRAAAD
jgi:hypothetical protein